MLIVIIDYIELFWKAGKRKYLLHTLQLVLLYQIISILSANMIQKKMLWKSSSWSESEFYS